MQLTNRCRSCEFQLCELCSLYLRNIKFVFEIAGGFIRFAGVGLEQTQKTLAQEVKDARQCGYFPAVG